MLFAATRSNSAEAKDLGGRLGIGIEQSIGGVTGLSFRYFFSEDLGIATTIGTDLAFLSGGDLASTFVGSVGLEWHVARTQHAHLGLGARVSVGWQSLTSAQLIDPTAEDADVQVALEIPLHLIFFLSDHFSVGVSTGILINFVPSSGETLRPDGAGGTTEGGAVGVGIGAGSVSGTLSVLYYF